MKKNVLPLTCRKTLQYIIIAIFILSIAALNFSCKPLKREAYGSFNRIYVFSDDAEAQFYKEHLSTFVEREIKTPKLEKVYTIFWGDTATFDRATHYHILIITASLNSPDFFGALLRKSLSAEARAAIERNEQNIFFIKDVWAKNQLVIFISGATPELTENALITGGERLYARITEYTNSNVAQWLFGSFNGRNERIDIEQKIARECHFTIRIPRMFELEKGSCEQNFIWLRALEPERWVFISWQRLDSIADRRISMRDIAMLRDSLCDIYYEGDVVDEQIPMFFTHDTLDGKPVLRYNGRWANHTTYLGGPFFGYILDDIAGNRRYMIDCAVFAPGSRKEPYLRHCEVIARTFSTAEKLAD